MNETRTLRDRDAAMAARQDRREGRSNAGEIAMLVQTATIDAYPTAAQAFYAANPGSIDAVEYEGGDATPQADTSVVYYFWNCGSQVPPSGTWIVMHGVAGRFVAQYDG